MFIYVSRNGWYVITNYVASDETSLVLLSTEIWDFMGAVKIYYVKILISICFESNYCVCAASVPCKAMKCINVTCNKMRQWRVCKMSATLHTSVRLNPGSPLLWTFYWHFVRHCISVFRWVGKINLNPSQSTWLNRSRQKNTTLRLIPVTTAWSCIALCSVCRGGWGRECPCVSGEVDTATHTAGAGAS